MDKSGEPGAARGARVLTIVGALLAVVLVVCGAVLFTRGGHEEAKAAGRPDDGGTPQVTAAAAIPWQRGAPSSIDAVRTEGGGRTLAVTVQVAAAAGGPGEERCARGLRGVVDTVEHGTVYVTVTYESRSADRRSGCTVSRPETTRVRLPKAVGDQQVFINSQDVFTAHGAKAPALRRCDDLGCDPAPVGCTDASYQQALADADVPRHSQWDRRGCDGRWLVLDVSSRTGAACGDPGPGCVSGVRTTRWFYRATADAWRAITTTRTAGCAAVRRAEPAFPEALCAGPAALRDPSATGKPVG
ncbi:hypothetical protein ACTPOK_12285 [Streptomyces inhibens]|uniref:hypothetical protein n=1 Tax=Streptomyces inhibens TaxID=2293571 RepID=UPI00402AE40B